jgi:teichuronic acid biosynthesis glycosyltransferase TuaG
MHLEVISVIISTYNRSKQTIDAVNAVINQRGAGELFDLEIIVIDDCSREAEFARISDAFRDTQVKILKTKSNSGGPAHPRNLGIAASHGKWIAFLDSDDLWDQSKLLTQLNAMKRAGTSASACSTTTNSTSVFFSTFERFAIRNSLLTRRHMFLGNSLAASSVIVSSKVVKLAGEFPLNESENFYEDYAFWLRIMTFTKVSMVGSELVFYDSDGIDTRSSKVKSHLDAIRNTLSDFYVWQCKSSNPKLGLLDKCLVNLQCLLAWNK